MKAFQLLTLCVALLAEPLKAGAQTGKLFTADRELSSSMVNCIYQDRSGVVWIATENGLNRYDGARFTEFKHEQGNARSLSNNSVNNVFEDSQGHFFVSTYDGLNLFDRARGTFKQVPLRSRGFTADHAGVQMVTQRRNGDVLVAVSGFEGIYVVHFDGDSVTAKNIEFKIPYAIVNFVFEDSKGRLWYSVENNGLYRYDGKRCVQAGGIPHTTVHAMCEDKQGRIYAGCRSGGLFMLDGSGTNFRQAGFTGQTAALKVSALLPDIDGNVLIGTDGNGLKSFNPAALTLTDVKMNTLELSAEKMKVHSLLCDSSGDLWIGAYQKGVLLLPSFKNGFELIGWRSATARLESSACVMSVIKTRGGTTLIGTDGDGLYTVSPQGSVRHYAHTAAANSVPSIITALFEDSRGTVWIGSYLEGVARLNAENGTCSYVDRLLNYKGQKVKSVNSFAEDREGRLWIGSNGDGLFSYDLATGRVTDRSGSDKAKNSLYNRWINAVLVASDGRIYVGAFGGMSCFDPKRKSWLSAFGTNRLLPNETIYTLCEDSRRDIWAGTSTGLVRLNPHDKSIKKFTTKDGLPSDMITAVRTDRKGNLWISTSHGLSQLDMRTMKFANFFADDGLQGNEFSKNAAIADGELLFGGTNGVTRFRPENIRQHKRMPDIRLAGLYINGQEAAVGMKSGYWQVTKEEVMKSKRFDLANSDNSFSLEFTAMEFYNPMRISYSYSINGRPWIMLQPGVNRVSFSRLAAGTYSFKVRSCDGGVYSKPLEFTVKIHPAWYASPLAYIIYVLLIAAAAWFLYCQMKRRLTIRREMQEHIYQENLKEAKLQFFINISHEIRTPMQLIISPLQKLISTDKEAGRQSQYQLIMHNAQRILRLINQLMDMRKIDKGKMRLLFRKTDVNSLVADVCQSFGYQMEKRRVTFSLTASDEHITAWLDPDNFDKILNNLLSNALKFTPPDGKIAVALSVAGDGENDASDGSAGTDSRMARYFQLTVSDTGIGIEPDKIGVIFERFYQINNNITANVTGTGVGLHLVKQLVTLHHGTITVSNNTPGKGCTFTVRIPLGRGHLKDDEIVEGETVLKTRDNAMPYATAGSVEQPAEEAAAKPKTRHKILLAEDEEEIREYVSHELAADFHVTACANGQEAWDRLRRESYDLLISDIMMPMLDGLTLCRKVKQNIHTNTVPVILLTAKTLEEEQIKGLDSGADAYITKPFSIDFLRTSVNNLLRNRNMLRTSFEGRQEQEVDITAMTEESPDEKLMRRIAKVINENISDPKLNIDKIAREVGISRVHLYRKLKELTNQSARDYLRNIRLKHAAELLKLGNSNVSRIAELTGFSNIAVFSHAFKEFYGVSPKEYASGGTDKTGE